VKLCRISRAAPQPAADNADPPAYHLYVIAVRIHLCAAYRARISRRMQWNAWLLVPSNLLIHEVMVNLENFSL
jgi:hypothetical protein